MAMVYKVGSAEIKAQGQFHVLDNKRYYYLDCAHILWFFNILSIVLFLIQCVSGIQVTRYFMKGSFKTQNALN